MHHVKYERAFTETDEGGAATAMRALFHTKKKRWRWNFAENQHLFIL